MKTRLSVFCLKTPTYPYVSDRPICEPPVISMSVSVVYDDASLSRYTMAPIRSFGFPLRFIGGAFCMMSTKCGYCCLSCYVMADSI